MELNKKQKEIVVILSEIENIKLLSTSRISFFIKSDFYTTQKYLEILQENKLIDKITRGKFSYWKITDEGTRAVVEWIFTGEADTSAALKVVDYYNISPFDQKCLNTKEEGKDEDNTAD
jgi:predicted transcriptional regulator